MIGFILRKLLWTLPAMIAISVITFFFLSYVPRPIDEANIEQRWSKAEIEAYKRERFLHLPRFVNLEPMDVKRRAEIAVQAIVDGSSDAGEAREELARLGGAALPYVLPTLDELPPQPRREVAIALAPVAERMDLPNAERARDLDQAVIFWSRFWDDRGIEFREAAVRTAVERLERYRTAARADELRKLDTYAMSGIMDALTPPTDEASKARAAALIELAANATGRDDRIRATDSVEEARACVERWEHFWERYGGDFIHWGGASRAAATLAETQYGKWALSLFFDGLGRTVDGTRVIDRLRSGGAITGAILIGGVVMAYALGILLGAIGAASRGRKVDTMLAAIALTIYAIPTVLWAVWLHGLGLSDGLLPAMVSVALGLVAAPARQKRAALVGLLHEDYMRTAFAKGASRLRVLVVHGFRLALVPIVMLVALEAPMALGATFVVEAVFELDGIGAATIRAVKTRDTAWLMVLSLVAASAAALGTILADLAQAALDPRSRSRILLGKSS